ncbi:MAG: hypothetical protein GF311_26625 [Candidatus Lokiarchaeota archaeon]|nr:hypothetical protein [Candidatus Lokiarchaeota archaeon]
MPLYALIAPMGGGKTLWTALYAKLWSLLNPHGKIYSNCHFNVPNFHYTPFMFMSVTQVKNCLIIADDYGALDNVKRLQNIIVNISRKRKITVLITGQEDKQIPKRTRKMVDMVMKPSFSKRSWNLFVKYRIIGRSTGEYYIKNPIKFIKKYNLYDTDEVVAFPLESDIKREILKHSETRRDLELNIYMYTGNKAERKSLMTELCEKKGWETPRDTKEKTEELLGGFLDDLNKEFKIQNDKIASYFSISESELYRKKRLYKNKLDEIASELI